MKFKISLVLFLMSVLSSCSWTSDPMPNELLQDRLARAEIKAEMYEEALQKYLEMVEQNPNRYSTHSNIGVLLGMIQKPEDAEKSLLHALKLAEKSKEPQALFTTRFNLGVLYGTQKKVPQALENYQQALEVLPTSVETKHNIELLIQQQNQQGEGESNSQDPNQQNQDGQNQQQKDDQQGKQDENKEDESKPKEDQKRENSPRYKPRPFAGDQLSEGDVKKILGELRNQEQKIRANFDKKEKGQSSDNEKDW